MKGCLVLFRGGSTLSNKGGGHPDPEIRGRAGLIFFPALRASVWSKNKGGPGPPGPSPGCATAVY